MITKRTFVVFVPLVAAVFVASSLLAAAFPSLIEASNLLQPAPSVRWNGRLIVAEHRRVEGGADDGERRATLHEVTTASQGIPGSRRLLPGEIDADYQLSPDATTIAFRATEGRQVEMLHLATHDRWRLALPEPALAQEAILYGWCVDSAALWVSAGDSLYLARTSQAGLVKLVAKAMAPGAPGMEACTSQVAIVAQDDGRRVTSAMSVDALRPLRVVPPLSYIFSDKHVCWRESFALETSGQELYGIGRREIANELLPSKPVVLTPAGGRMNGAEPLELGLSAFLRPGCLLGAVGSKAVYVLEVRGTEVLERERYADQPELYAALSRTRDQPVWLGGTDRRVVAYVDPACQRKIFVRDLETRLTDSIWPSGRVGDCGESVPLGWAADRVVALSWLP
jgi:hypothetical protein